MKFINDQAVEIRNILQNTTTIAVVGLSPKPSRPSNQVAQYLKNTGYTIIPVNPGQDTLLGLPCYPNLKAIPGQVDMVDIFRRQMSLLPITEVKAIYYSDRIRSLDEKTLAASKNRIEA